jgi:predicted RNase H-like HicB family nuclease
MPKTLFYKAIFEPATEGGYTVYVPSLPGCVSEGNSYNEALDNIREAMSLYLETLKERRMFLVHQV